MDDESPLVPSLSPSDDTPAERPMSRSVQKRRATKTCKHGAPDERPCDGCMFANMPFAPPTPVELAKPTPLTPAPRIYKRYKLTTDFLLYRGASETTMEAGLILSEQHYDIGGLVKQGALLEPLD